MFLNSDKNGGEGTLLTRKPVTLTTATGLQIRTNVSFLLGVENKCLASCYR